MGKLKIVIPEYVKKTMNILNKNGFEAYVAGGAVRDAMLGECPNDWDIATDARVEDVQNCFERHFDTGIKHGTVTVITDGNPVEITTYRIEGEYEKNRRPKSVEFTADISEDLKRRDFTINAMAYNDEEGIKDLFGGAEDLKNRIIRCVGDPDKRFSEDALRIMRAVRFSSRLGFEIEEHTMDAVKRNCGLLRNISAERIRSELTATLLSADDVNVLFDSGIMSVIIPEADNNSRIVHNVRSDEELKYSALFYGKSTETVRGILSRLKFDNRTKYGILNILNCCYRPVPKDAYMTRKALNIYGKDVFVKSLELLKAAGTDTKEMETLFNDVKNDPYAISMICVTGGDIVNLGFGGRKVGEIMDYLMESVLRDPGLNSHSALIDEVKRHFVKK